MTPRPFLVIAADLRDRIRAGEFAPGDLIPSVRQLVEQHGVAHATAFKAVRALAAEGLVRSVKGVGNLVTQESERGWSASMWVERSRRSGRVYPPGQRARIIAAGTVDAPLHVAQALGLDDGETAIRRNRVTYEGDIAVSASTSWFPAAVLDIAPALAETDRIPEGSFTYLAVALGRRVAGWQDQYDPGIATADDAALLGIAEGAALHRGRNWVYDEQDEILEFGESISTARIVYMGRIDA